MLMKELAVLTLIILYINCSKVIDEHKQALYVSDYCPKIGTCDEGTHVMCQFYNPDKQNGYSCRDVQDFTVTPEIAENLLNVLNGMRSRLSRGLESGKKKFPRAYGLIKLEWDPELATIAHVHVNQCMYEKNACCATKKFSDPGLLLNGKLFTDPEWLLLLDLNKFVYKGYSDEKAKHALTMVLKRWYETRKDIDPDAVLGKRKWDKKSLQNSYLQIVQAANTHVGCGAAAFRKLRMRNYPLEDVRTRGGDILNWVMLMCIFSSRPKGEDLYDTEIQEGNTEKCGCPPGYDEDPDCLCYRTTEETDYIQYGKSKVPVVVLPIFTMENAPPDKLTSNRSEPNPKTMLRSQNIFDIGIRSTEHFKPSLFSKTPTFILPSRKFLQNLDILNNSNTYQNVKFGIVRTNDESKPKFQESKIVSKQQRIRQSGVTDGNDQVYDLDGLTRHDRRHDEDFPVTELDLSVQNFDANVSDSTSKGTIVNLLSEIEIVAKNTKLNKTQRDILGKKIQRIYKLFLEKTKYLTTERTVHGEFDSLDHEQDKLYKFEDQIRTIKYDNIDEPVYENQNFADIYNSMKESALGFQGRRSLNFDDVRNAHDLRNNKKYEVNKNVDLISMEDDLLPLNKRQYYENKLNNLERKIRQMQILNPRKYEYDSSHIEDTIPGVV